MFVYMYIFVYTGMYSHVCMGRFNRVVGKLNMAAVNPPPNEPLNWWNERVNDRV